MYIKVLCALVLLSGAICKPHFVELDEEEKQLYRAAYDTYDDDDEDRDIDLGVLTPKDSTWLMKAKLKEVKEFMRSLSANLLATKLKIKELMKHKLHFHKHVDKKPSYSYQHHQPSYETPHTPQTPQYGQYGHEGHYNY